MIAVQIKNEVIEWLMDRLDYHYDDALELAQEFVGMLYATGGFADPESEVDPGSSAEEQAADKDWVAKRLQKRARSAGN